MKSDTQFFIDKVMDGLDFCFIDSRDYKGAQQYLLDEIDDYDGPNIVVSFRANGDGMVHVDVFNGEKSSKEKLVLMEDNLDIEQSIENINEMIRDVITKTELVEEPKEEEKIDYNERINFDNIYNANEQEEKAPRMLCKAYLDKDGSVLLVFNDFADKDNNLVCYAHNGQHSACNPYYLDELEELSPKNKKVKELATEYENLGPEKIELILAPIGEMLPIQTRFHKEIQSGD